jgi:hypothetical protein
MELLRLKEELRQLKIAHKLASSIYERNTRLFKKSLVQVVLIETSTFDDTSII